MQMKKIIGILLAMCFVLSVTAAAASANDGGRGHHDGPGDYNKPKFDHHKPKFDDHKRHHDFNRGHWVPGHYETKVIKTVKWFHGEKIVIKKFVKVWVPAHWVPSHPRW